MSTVVNSRNISKGVAELGLGNELAMVVGEIKKSLVRYSMLSSWTSMINGHDTSLFELLP